MRVAAVSDLHGKLPDPDLFAGADVVAIAGDILPDGWETPDIAHQREWRKRVYFPWAAAVSERITGPILEIPGNHDFLYERTRLWWVDRGPPRTLIDSPYTYEGKSFYGTPWSNQFYNWAFMAEEEELARRWDEIPRDTDVLIVHGPPYGAGDRTLEGVYAGSVTLRRHIETYGPPVIITGHIHEAYGHYRIGDTDVYNVAWLDRHYRAVRDSVVMIDI